MKISVSHQWWLRLLALFVLLALGPVHADITKAQSFDYRLGPGDRIQVAVFGRSDLSGIYTIRNSGLLSLPVAGEISAANLTLNQLETEIGNQYSVLMKSESGPDQAITVNIEIVEYRPFYIMGDVSRPGSYEYQDRLTVLRAVAIAGGYNSSGPDARVNKGDARSDSAEEKELPRVRITRETDQGTVSFDAADSNIVLPGDIISVPVQAGETLLSLPGPGQQAESVKAARAEEDAISETEAARAEEDAISETEAARAEEDAISETEAARAEEDAISETEAARAEEDAISETEAARAEEDAISETEAGGVTALDAIPAAVDPTSDYVYTVYLFSTTSEKIADQVNQKFQQAGHESRIIVPSKTDVTSYRIAVTGFESRQAAQQYAESITGTLGVTSTWIGRNRTDN